MPKPNVVYVKDADEFKDNSDIKDVTFDTKDEKFFREFSTGAVSMQWQKEMIDSGVFDELNSATVIQCDRETAWKTRLCVLF